MTSPSPTHSTIQDTKLVDLADCQCGQLYDYWARNYERLARWEPRRYPGAPRATDCEAIIEKAKISRDEEIGSNFALLGGEMILGVANFTNVSGFPFRACNLGFSVDGSLEGKGFAHHMLRQANRVVFDRHKLNRICAAFMPSNSRSARILHRLGFRIEGYAERYLEINETWEDHFLTSLLRSRWQDAEV